MKKIMGHVTGKLSLSILTMFVLLVGVLAGLNKITTKKASAAAAARTSQSKLTKDAVTAAMAKVPMKFEPNRGQTDSQVKYVARSSGYNVFLTGGTSAVMVFPPARHSKDKADRLTMNLVGANAAAQDRPQDNMGSVTNYYIGNDRSKWHEGVPNYAKVRYNDVYRGIDVVYQGDDNHFRYDFVVNPGADPKAIRMSYEGAKGVRLNEKGEVVAAMSKGDSIASKPYIYQEIAGKKHVVDGGYVLTAKNEVEFQVGAYDTSKALIIDPGLTYATYFGGGQTSPVANTTITGIAMDFSGVYFVGTTTDLKFDANILSGGTTDVVVGSFNTALTKAGTLTVLSGGPLNNDEGNGIAINASNVVVVGDTNSGINFPGVSSGGVVNQPLKLSNAGEINLNQHAFVAVMGKSATTLGTTSIMAGLGAEQAIAVAIDRNGKLHVVGQTSSSDFVTNLSYTGASAQPTLQSDNQTNAFYVNLSSDLKTVSYATFLGGFGYDRANAIAVDSNGLAYITGVSTSWTGNPKNPPQHQPFPIQPPLFCGTGIPATVCIPVQNPPKPPMTLKTFTGGVHAFVAAFNPAATGGAPSLLYSLPLGGDLTSWYNPTVDDSNGPVAVNESDIGTSITVDNNFNVYVGGNSCGNAQVGNNNLVPFGISPSGISQTFELNVVCTGSASGTLHMSVGNGPGATGSGSNHNVVFTAPAVLDPVLGTAAGPGVVAQINVTNGGFYNSTPTVTIDPPSLPRGTLTCPFFLSCQAKAVAIMSGHNVIRVDITNQGFGYTVPPAVTFSGGGGASASVVVGTVILGNQTAATVASSPAQDGWVVAINNPGSYTISYNGISLISGAPGDITLPPGAGFPAFEFGTLANGDEANGNGTGNPSTPNSVNQVTGVVTDSGVVATGPGTTGALGNVYVSGGSSASTLTSATLANIPVLIRRRINTAGFDATIAPFSAHPKSPFLRNVTNWGNPAQTGVSSVGDIELGSVLTGTGTPPLPASTNTATGVAFDTSTNRSCVGATLTGPGVIGGTTFFSGPPATATAAYPGSADDGLIACVPFLFDTTVTSINGGLNNTPTGFGGVQGGTISFTMQAGATPTSQLPFTPLVTSNSNTATVSLTNPNSLVQPPTFGILAYSPGGLFGPPSGSAPFVPWLQLSNTVNAAGTSVLVSLLDQAHINDPNHLNPASQLDPGFYQAVFYVIPSTQPVGTTPPDNANVPIFFTVNLIVTGNIYTNTNVGGGTAAITTVNLLEGKGWTDVGTADKLINIPIVSAVPIESPSFSNIVFDLARDAFGNPIYTQFNTAGTGNTYSSPTAYPVLGPASLNGFVTGVLFTPGSNYPPNVQAGTLTFSPPTGLSACGATPPASEPNLACAAGTFTTSATGHVTSVVITKPGGGYSNPPSVTFPLPNAGGTQAVATSVSISGSIAGMPDGGTVNLRPTTGLTPGTIGCGQSPYGNDVPPLMGLSFENACYIQVDLPSTILSGAAPGTYSSTFYLDIPNDTVFNEPSEAPESMPPSPSTVITFSPVGTTTFPNTNTSVAVTINVVVGVGSLVVTSPWISNTAPFIINPPTVPPMMPLAPFSVPFPYAGTVSSDNNGVPFIAGVTGNNPVAHAITLDARNLQQPQGLYSATVTPGIDANAQLAFTETVDLNNFANITSRACNPNNENATCVLPIPTCTTTSPTIPSTVLTFTSGGILPASNAPVTATETTINIVNPQAAGLVPGFYASTITYSALTAAGQPVLDGTGAPVAVRVPVCLEVGNNLEYDVFDASNHFTNIAAGSALGSNGFLLMEAGDEPQNLEYDVFGVGPSQNPLLQPAGLIPGGPLFAPPATNLQVPVTMNTANGNQSWTFPPTFPAGSGNQMGQNCAGTQPANYCTPASRTLSVSPGQNVGAAIYQGIGFSVTPNILSGLFGSAPNPLAATLPVYVTSGPTIVTNPPATSNPLGNVVSGSVILVNINNSGSGYNGGLPPAITFAGGCVNEPTATAVIDPVHGSISNILLTTLGSSCTVPPIVTIAPPTTVGGTQATATAVISDATVNVSFDETVGALNTNPATQSIWIMPSDETRDIDSFGPLFFNSPNVQIWLDADETNNCNGNVPFNPNMAEPGFFNGCQVLLTPRGLVVSSLAPGTYTAWMVIHAHPPVMPEYTAVVVTLNVHSQSVPPTCALSITDSGNNTTGTSLTAAGTSTSGFTPSVPRNLTVSATPASACGIWTASVTNTGGVAPFVTISGPTTGTSVGTISYNAFANTLLSARANTITVTAGAASTTYTVNEAGDSGVNALSTDPACGTVSPNAATCQAYRETRAIYQRLLGREGDAGGFAFWTGVATGSASGLGNMVDNFLISQESLYTNFQIIAIYQDVLGRIPTFAEWSTAKVAFTANNTPNGWIAAGQALGNSLLNSQEYANNIGSPTNLNNVVTSLYMKALGVAPTAAQLSNGNQTILNGGTTNGLYAELMTIWGMSTPTFNPTQPPTSYFTSPTFDAASNPAYIVMLYYTILARGLDAGGQSSAGYQFWLGIANSVAQGGGPGVYFFAQPSAGTPPAIRALIEGNGTPNQGFATSNEFVSSFNH